jgi:hypothetical protein
LAAPPAQVGEVSRHSGSRELAQAIVNLVQFIQPAAHGFQREMITGMLDSGMKVFPLVQEASRSPREEDFRR